MPPTLADLENDRIRRPMPILTSTPENQGYQRYSQTTNTNDATPPKPLTQILREYANKLILASPTLYYASFISLVVFFLFQIPALGPIVRDHLVCSTFNLRHYRYHTLLSSALSHATIGHLAMNLYAFHTFGRSVAPTLASNGLPLLPFCTAAALFANALFLLLTPAGASCVGLSGVALALLALDARLRPGRELAFVVRFVPVRLPAQHALAVLLGWSVLGTVGVWVTGRSDGVAHATHLGGLAFGLLVYEGLKGGCVRDWRAAFLGFWGRSKGRGRLVKWR